MKKEHLEVLKKPFPESVIGVKLQSRSKDKTKALLVLYLQHTDVADRLEEVDPGWTFTCEKVDRRTDGQDQLTIVQGTLEILGIRRENFGEGEDEKSAASDCLKRCAMLFGVGRYLYDQEMVWVPYNESTDKYKHWSYSDYKKFIRHKEVKPAPIFVQPEPVYEKRLPTGVLQGMTIVDAWQNKGLMLNPLLKMF